MNITNIKNLLKAYFIENWKRDVMMAGLIASMEFLSNMINPYSNGFVIIAAVVILLMSMPQRLFGNLSNASQSIHYLMIPANYKEKITTNMFLANIYAVVLLLLSVLFGYALSFVVLKITGANSEMITAFLGKYKSYHHIGASVLMFYTALAVFFFGAVYFRKKQMMKTLAASMAVIFAFAALCMLVLWLNVRLTMHTGMVNVQYSFIDSSDLSDQTFDIIGYILTFGSIIFFYTLSFIRLRETNA